MALPPVCPLIDASDRLSRSPSCIPGLQPADGVDVVGRVEAWRRGVNEWLATDELGEVDERVARRVQCAGLAAAASGNPSYPPSHRLRNRSACAILGIDINRPRQAFLSVRCLAVHGPRPKDTRTVVTGMLARLELCAGDAVT